MFSVNALSTSASAKVLPLLFEANHPAAPPLLPGEAGKVFGRALACLAECHESGPVFIELNDIARYCALLCGQHVDHAGRPLVPIAHFLALDSGIPFIPGNRMPVARCVMLASLYIAVCRDRAFLEDQSFDVAGLYSFVGACVGTSTGTGGGLNVGDKSDAIALMFGVPDAHHRCFSEIVLTPLGNQFELRPADGPALRLGMGKLVATNASNETMNAPWLKNATLQDCHLEDISFGAVDLTGLRLQRCSLKRISMIGTQLRKTQWLNVTLTACHFEGCCLERATFQGSTFQDVSFTRCNFTLSCFVATAMEAVAFAGCTLEGMSLSGLEQAPHAFPSITLSRMTFRECLWRNMTIKGIRFQESTFGHMVRPPPVGKNHLERCAFSDCTIDVACRFLDSIVDTTFQRCALLHANFTAVRLRDVAFHESTFVRARFDLAEWRRGAMRACQGLAGASFARALLWDVFMTGESIPSVCTLGNMNGIDFSFASLSGGGFRALQLCNASFESVHATNVRWENCTLQAANLANTRFDNAVFSACQLHTANFECSVGADLISFIPNRYTTWTGTGARHGLIGEPSSFALSLESTAKLSDPIERARLLTYQAAPDPITGQSRVAARNREAISTLVGNILALPAVRLRQLAMVSLINVLNAKMSAADWMKDADILLPLLCQAEYVGNPIIDAFIERRITRLLHEASPENAPIAALGAPP